ncbi:UBX domain-containing protein 2B [Drosophila innubila]|uniref:UBX domain-containing protein 2B n=1 Tax=Drosophila innubila TaxID=198719 RepID=UPI00148DF903|nr:UBX domain-containing protein 2B [Drosophila innubila]
MSDEQKLTSFMNKYGVPEEIARQYLTENNWALEQAGNRYEADKAKVPSSSGITTITTQTLHSLQSLLSRQTRAREDEPEGYFAGASDSSHQRLDAPQMSKRVQIDDSTPALTTVDSDRSLRTWGHGVRLGSAHPINPPPARDAEQDTDSELEENEHMVVVLHLWSEGFSLDDGSLRLYEVPENERFLRAIMRGDFPYEMQELGQRIELSVQDHTNESYRQLSRKQFMGSGRPLGTPASPLDPVAQSTPVQSPQELQQQQEQAAEQALSLNGQMRVTTIQFRLANGSRIAANFNCTHQVADLYRYVRIARPQYSSENFMLLTAFPRHQLLEDDARTLAEADLLNVVVIQHINEDAEQLTE